MFHFHTHRAQYSIDNILQNEKSKKKNIHWMNLIIPGYEINNINSDYSLL